MGWLHRLYRMMPDIECYGAAVKAGKACRHAASVSQSVRLSATKNMPSLMIRILQPGPNVPCSKSEASRGNVLAEMLNCRDGDTPQYAGSRGYSLGPREKC